MQQSGAGGGAADKPTGCFKCGRPGHWSRDCPSAPATNPNTNPNPNPNPNFSSSKFSQQPPSAKAAASATTPAAKKKPKTRPKLTPELLLSDDGLGYVLRHFPSAFKHHGRGHEVTDLGNLIGMYSQWHSHLIPYYSFDQFVHKVEQVGATKRVRRCISELRERVARGGDPTKLHEPQVEQVAPGCEQELTDIGDPVTDKVDPPLESHDADDIQEEMIDEIYQNTTEESAPLHQEPCQASSISITAAASEVNTEQIPLEQSPNRVAASSAGNSSKTQITEDQRARMEANRLKALERAAARERSSLAP